MKRIHSSTDEDLHSGCVTRAKARARHRAGISLQAAEGLGAARSPNIGAADVDRRTVKVTSIALTLR